MAHKGETCLEHASVYGKVVAALQFDAERHRQNASLLGAGTCINEQSEDNHLDEDQHSTAGSRFRKAHRRLALVQRLGSVGVRTRHLKQFSKFYGRGHVRSQESEVFLGRMLNSAALMSRATEVLQMFHSPLFGADAECDKSHVFGLIAQSLHDIKKATIMGAWQEHVKPLRDELSELSMKHDSLKTQFKEARSTYLKEVSELRDTARIRGDPLSGFSLDVVWFHEPTQSLDHEERKFLLHVLREKLKMLFENNPKVVKTFDFGQLEKLIGQVESTECKQLRESLKRKAEEMTQLQQAFSWNNAKQPKVCPVSNPGTDLDKERERVIQALTLQVEEIRNQKDEVSQKHHAAVKQIECSQTERDELAAELRSELAVKCMLQTECEQLRMKIDQLEEAKAACEQKVDSLGHILQEREDKIKSLEGTVQRSLGRCAVGQQTAPEKRDFIFQQAMGHEMDNTQVPLQEKSPAVRQADDNFGVPEDNSELAELRKKCAKLQELVSMHLAEQSRTDMEMASEEADYLSLVAGSLGCMENGIKDCDFLDGIRVCKCSNLLMEDSKFCRKCGQEWKPHKEQTRHQVIAALSVQLGNVATQLEEAIKNLNEELNHKHGPSRAHCIAEAERKVTRLQREQKGFETQLILERSAQSFEEVKPLLQLETCSCDCFQELEVTMGMMKQLQVLCAEMTVKIREATDDNVQLTSALDTTLVSLGAAKKFISLSKAMKPPVQDEDLIKGVDALNEAEHHCVFHRLFNPSSETKDKWKQRREKLVESSFEVLKPGLLMETDPQHSPIFAAARKPCRRRPSPLRNLESASSDKMPAAESVLADIGITGHCAAPRETSVDDRLSMQTDLGEFIIEETMSTQATDDRISMESDLERVFMQGHGSNKKANIHADTMLSVESAIEHPGIKRPKNSPTSCAIRRTMYRGGACKDIVSTRAVSSHVSKKNVSHLDDRLSSESNTASLTWEERFTDERLTLESFTGDFAIEGFNASSKLSSKEETLLGTNVSPRRGSISLPIHRHAFHSNEGANIERERGGLAVAGFSPKVTRDASPHCSPVSLSGRSGTGQTENSKEGLLEGSKQATSGLPASPSPSPRRSSVSLPMHRGGASKLLHRVSTHTIPSPLNQEAASRVDESLAVDNALDDFVVEGRRTKSSAPDPFDSDGHESSCEPASPRQPPKFSVHGPGSYQLASSSRQPSKCRSGTAADAHDSPRTAQAAQTPSSLGGRSGRRAPEGAVGASIAPEFPELQVFNGVDASEKSSERRAAPGSVAGSRRRSSSGGLLLPPMGAPESKPRMLVQSSGRSPSPRHQSSGSNAPVLTSDPNKPDGAKVLPDRKKKYVSC